MNYSKGTGLLILWLCALLSFNAPAAEFAASISPPRFELEADPGDVLREVIEVTNVGSTAAEMLVRTADWGLNEEGGVIIYPDTLQGDSCRPWTRIERHRMSIAARYKRNYRFEVHVPEDAEAGECRFAILFEQPRGEADVMSLGDVSLPVLGRIAVIVYVSIGDVAPVLQVREVIVVKQNSRRVPALVIENSGAAHGRARGILKAVTAEGQEINLVVSSAPILPGKTREIILWPRAPGGEEVPTLAYPVSITGKVEWPGGEYEIDTVVAPRKKEAEG